MKKYQKRIVTSCFIVLGIIVLNIIISTTTGVNVLSNTVNFITNKKSPNEIKSISLTSDGYNDNTGGSYDIKKSAEWTGTDTAQINFNIDTRMKTSNSYKDVILVLDISGSMFGDKLNKVKSDAKELTEFLLSDQENRVALITFDSISSIEYELTNNKDELLSKIGSLTDTGCTNYNQALINVDKVLEGYEKKNNRDLVVLFLTDGYPNEETPNQVSQYKMLKEKYPYITINGIQYEMGKDIIEDIKNISDNQYIASMDTLNNVLFEAIIASDFYEKFELVDYIDNEYFYVENVNDIKVSIGKVELTEENGVQKVIWRAEPNEFRTGSSVNMTINLKLKEQYVGNEGYYPTNKKFEVTTKLPDEKEETKETDKTPILKSGYKVIYDTNTPTDCDISNFEETHYAFENVKISDKELTCEGYQFKGWEVVDNVKKINDDYFIMPSNDVTIKAIWSKQSISKSMDGMVYEGPTLYETIAEQSVLDNMSSKYVTGSAGIDFSKISSDTNGKGVYTLSSTIGEEYPIYYYRGAVDNNNVIFANFCWKIVRTTETGGVKLIYNGLPNNGVCNNMGTAASIGNSKFNNSSRSPAYIGYMYGNEYLTKTKDIKGTEYKYGTDVIYENGHYNLVNAIDIDISNYNLGNSNYHYTCFDDNDNCDTVYYINQISGSQIKYIELNNGTKIESALEEMNKNDKDSTIKIMVDSWYKEKMVDYTNYLEDTIWCNNRGISNYGGWNINNSFLNDGGVIGTTVLKYSAFSNLRNWTPNLVCANINDRFTVDKVNGNGALTYPVGLITSDEIMYAGGRENIANKKYYLFSSSYYWAMSPHYYYNNDSASVTGVNSDGYINDYSYSPFTVTYSFSVRPSVSLKSNIHYISGDGTADNPYIITE